MMHRLRRAIGVGLITVLAAACAGSDGPVPSDDTTSAGSASDVTTTGSAATRSIPTETAASTDEGVGSSEPEEPTTAELADIVTEDDLAVFLAAAELAIEGTSLAGTVLDDPDIYISLAQSACARFTDGADFDTVASDVLESLGAEGNDDAILVGALLGAATGTICPEHADQI